LDSGTPAAKRMLDQLHYVDGDLGDPAIYQAMSDTLGQSVQRVLFYLEVPPPLFARIAEGISTVGRTAGNRVMVEKPFGNDLASASKLNDTMHQFFPEDAIYRVDHWLGLDPVESLMFARLANSIIEPILNRNYVQSVQITMAEAFDVADRGSLRWLQTLSIGNLAISVFRRNDAFRDRLPQLEVLYRPPSADTHADPVSGIATTP
jgi:glucose-6-phosphate 1-dehydrogenase